MKFVGIATSVFKKTLVSKANEVGNIVTLDLPCLTANDCSRHFELLDLFDCNKTNYENTEYYKFSINNRNQKDVIEKINNFNNLYKSIKENGYDYSKGYIIVSSDGARLDGSHRSSILEHLQYAKIDVIMVDWLKCFTKKEIRGLLSHISSQKAQYNT